MDFSSVSLFPILQVIWINIVLSGDNAVVIALACRGLPAGQRRMGMVLGAGVAIVLRIIFTVLVAKLLATPYLKLAGSLLLFWIAVKLLTEDDEGAEDKIKANDRLWPAVRTVAIADMVMSLDNVLAIAAVAKNDTVLLVIGLLISIPLIIAGATIVMALLARFLILVWAGSGLLGWVAGAMLVTDPAVVGWLASASSALVHADSGSPSGFSPIDTIEYAAAGVGALFVLATGYLLKHRHAGPAT